MRVNMNLLMCRGMLMSESTSVCLCLGMGWWTPTHQVLIKSSNKRCAISNIHWRKARQTRSLHLKSDFTVLEPHWQTNPSSKTTYRLQTHQLTQHPAYSDPTNTKQLVYELNAARNSQSDCHPKLFWGKLPPMNELATFRKILLISFLGIIR